MPCRQLLIQTLKLNVHYAVWSETCSRTLVRCQVFDGFIRVCDLFATFSGRKAGLGQDRAIMACLIAQAGVRQVRCVVDLLETTRRTHLLGTSASVFFIYLNPAHYFCVMITSSIVSSFLRRLNIVVKVWGTREEHISHTSSF